MAGTMPARNEMNVGRIVQAVRELFQGRSLATGTVTLTASATSTTVRADNCGDESLIVLSPLTANAAAALATTYVSDVTNGSFTLTHANNAQTDRNFGWEARG